MKPLPLPVRLAAGLVATALEQARDLPRQLVELPVTAVSQTLQASMRVQQKITELAIKGDRALSVLRPVEEKPSWATFDDEEPPAATNGASVTPLRPLPPLSQRPSPQDDRFAWLRGDAELEALADTDSDAGAAAGRADNGAAPASAADPAAVEGAAVEGASDAPDASSVDVDPADTAAATDPAAVASADSEATSTGPAEAGAATSAHAATAADPAAVATAHATTTSDAPDTAVPAATGSAADRAAVATASQGAESGEPDDTAPAAEPAGAGTTTPATQAVDGEADGAPDEAVEKLDTVADAEALEIVDAAVDDEGGAAAEAPAAAGPAVLPAYPTMSIPQLRGHLRHLTLPQLHELLEWEEAHGNRPPFVTMLGNRITTVAE